MIRIDKSTAGGYSSNVVIKRWVKQDAAGENSVATSDDYREHINLEEQNKLAAEKLETLAKKHVQKMVDDAQDTADSMLEEAAKEAENIQLKAYEDGFAKGKEEALHQEAEHAENIRRQFLMLLKELRASEESRNATMEENILKLSLKIAEKIVNLSMENDDSIFMGLVKEAVSRLNAREKFTIHLNQREYDRFFAEGSGWLSDAIQSASFSVTADAFIAPGGITVISQDGVVRAGVDTQLEKLRKALLQEEE